MRPLMWCGVFAGAALAVDGSAAQSFNVSAEIVPGCAVRGTLQTTALALGTIDFGSIPATRAGIAQASAPTGATGGIALECTAGLTLTLAVDGGQHASGSFRRLASAGGAHLLYELYADAARQTAVPLTGGVSINVPAGGSFDVPIHAIAYLPGGGQAPGSYTDTVAVTLSW